LRKLQPLKVDGSGTQKNKPLNITKSFPNHSKTSLYVALSLLEFNDDLLKNSRSHSYSTLNHFKCIRNKKVRSFESKRGPKRRKKRKKNNTVFVR
jgi:hypothetical protein